jgi:hypothetical protein
MAVKFEDNTIKVINAMNDKINAVLEECAGELESAAKQNTRVDTSKTKNSWQHRVTKDGDGFVAAVGSDYENAIWEEFGTGDYALNGDGRKGGWAYKDPKTGETIWTHGKRPRRPFHHAYTTMMPKIIKFLQDQFRGKLS